MPFQNSDPMNRRGYLFALSALCVVSVAASSAAGARDLLFRFRNMSGTPLQVQLYADGRKNVWPSANMTWVLPPDRRIYVNPISCQRGESICFGAWINGRTDFYWGTGKNKQNHCVRCCYRCTGRQTEIIVFNPPNLSPRN
jgi:hypothetical protein